MAKVILVVVLAVVVWACWQVAAQQPESVDEAWET